MRLKHAFKVCAQNPRLKSASKMRAQIQRSNNNNHGGKKQTERKIRDLIQHQRYFEDNTNISKMVLTIGSRGRLHACMLLLQQVQ